MLGCSPPHTFACPTTSLTHNWPPRSPLFQAPAHRPFICAPSPSFTCHPLFCTLSPILRTVPYFAHRPLFCALSPILHTVPYFAHCPLSRVPSPRCMPSPLFARRPRLGCGMGNCPETHWWGARSRRWGREGWDTWGGGLGWVMEGHIGTQWWGLKSGGMGVRCVAAKGGRRGT